MCLFIAARVIVEGSLVSAMSLSSCPFLSFSCILPAQWRAEGGGANGVPARESKAVGHPKSEITKIEML